MMKTYDWMSSENFVCDVCGTLIEAKKVLKCQSPLCQNQVDDLCAIRVRLQPMTRGGEITRIFCEPCARKIVGKVDDDE